MDRLERISSNASARPLHVINILAFIPGIVLLLITALTTPAGSIYLIAIAPLTLSTLLGVAGRDRPMPWTSIRKVSHYSQPRSCPNCKYAVPPLDDGPRWGLYKPHDMPLRDSNQELYHSTLTDYQAELAASRDSSEFQTSGCNTPR
ncbi:hypothetical protein MBLNU13_g03053t1 [Cladosporium sp. NU13]